MEAKATYFKVTSTSDVAASPKLEISAELVLCDKGEIVGIDTAEIRKNVENACSVFVSVRSRVKK